ncbi:hypothetical protein Lalb_Chr07g0177281 [Lupinus albus]|uniref:Uncharacterized protein n=1 Tax=Lupinus albus TaxID=3870 RepID=A0A6A4Q7R2_LUPAL|nr:hypothetical protein Lalb_Chr07g0177281 [Lupinus albus]
MPRYLPKLAQVVTHVSCNMTEAAQVMTKPSVPSAQGWPSQLSSIVQHTYISLWHLTLPTGQVAGHFLPRAISGAFYSFYTFYTFCTCAFTFC